MPDITIIIPAYNEAGSLPLLLAKVRDVLLARFQDPRLVGVIVVDDGSTDDTSMVVEQWARQNEIPLNLIRFRKNRGKSAALSVAFGESTGSIVVTMDADLQDDPEEINKLIDKLNEGYDLVSGWKQTRKDPIMKRWPSRLFNWVTSLISGVRLRDFNCGLKAYRSEVVKEIKLYGELHRYIPVLAAWRGFRIAEIPVKHHARQFGKSKFGIERYARGFLDLLTVLFLSRYEGRPLHLFGGIGLIFISIGMAIEFYFVVLWFSGVGIGQRPLFFLGILLIIAGLQSFFFGLLGDMLASSAENSAQFSVTKHNSGDDLDVRK